MKKHSYSLLEHARKNSNPLQDSAIAEHYALYKDLYNDSLFENNCSELLLLSAPDKRFWKNSYNHDDALLFVTEGLEKNKRCV